MNAPARHVAVVDIGKTNAKLALVDLETCTEGEVLRAPNTSRSGPPFAHLDTDGLWRFIIESLRRLGARHPVDAIAVTTHGCAAALVDDAGRLTLPILDYEDDSCASVRSEYETVRPTFAESGTPPLPHGLNLGAQLYWQAKAFPQAFAATDAILTYPQYWAFRLCGVRASEVTSLGCHSDLWNPGRADFSSMVEALGWRDRFPPLRAAGDTLGPLLPDVARATGLDAATPVLCGIHDSNASLLPHLLIRQSPFAVASTGTWVIAMALGGKAANLDARRDTLVNVNALGGAVPSARFMGGREFALLTGSDGAFAGADVDAVLDGGIMLMPSVVPDCGPFPGSVARWAGEEPQGPRRAAAASLYLSLMTATCLDLVGAEGPVVVEGSFSSNPAYGSMLAAATGRPVLMRPSATGTSIGTAMLAGGGRRWPPLSDVAVATPDARWSAYAERWRSVVGA